MLCHDECQLAYPQCHTTNCCSLIGAGGREKTADEFEHEYGDYSSERGSELRGDCNKFPSTFLLQLLISCRGKSSHNQCRNIVHLPRLGSRGHDRPGPTPAVGPS
eukprot:1184389-Prorocentrum_minimum.AAC.1